MRDVNTGPITAGRDVHFHDQSNESKLLVACTTEELFQEQQHRKALLSSERRAKTKRFSVPWVALELVIIGLVLWQYLQGDHQTAYKIFEIGSGLLTSSICLLILRPTEFEARQMEALHEIGILIKEQGGK